MSPNVAEEIHKKPCLTQASANKKFEVNNKTSFKPVKVAE